jgi:hypothetical protein
MMNDGNKGHFVRLANALKNDYHDEGILETRNLFDRLPSRVSVRFCLQHEVLKEAQS